MTDANPYASPDAVLGSVQEIETYQPSIFSFGGRIGRMRYIAYSFGINMAIGLLAGVAMGMMGATAFMAGDTSAMSPVFLIIMGVIYIFSIVISVMFGKRRLNDLNRSGWWMLLFLSPMLSIVHPFLGVLVLLSLALVIYMIFFPGASGDNDFGAAPTANSVGVLILAWLVIVLFVGSIAAAFTIPAMMGMP